MPSNGMGCGATVDIHGPRVDMVPLWAFAESADTGTVHGGGHPATSSAQKLLRQPFE